MKYRGHDRLYVSEYLQFYCKKDQTDMLGCWTIRAGECQGAAEIVGRQCSDLGCCRWL